MICYEIVIEIQGEGIMRNLSRQKRSKLSLIYGIVICILIATAAFFAGKAFPIVGGPVFGILIGMLVAFFKRPEYFERGIKFTSGKVLRYSIILLGFEMNLYKVLEVGKMSLIIMMFTLSSAFITAFIIGKLLKIEGKTSTLIGVGTSICGGSAIAATAPVISADDKEIAQAISTIFLFNIIAVFLFPPLGRLMNLSDIGFGMWAGTAINDTSSVVAAGAAWSAHAGNNTALAFATIVKLTRTLMIVPITLVLAIYFTRKSAKSSDSARTEGFNFVRTFPWFVIGFVIAAIINTFLTLPAGLPEQLTAIGKFMIIMAMSAIGLNTNIIELLKSGRKPILLGLACWFAVASVSILTQSLTSLV